MNITLVQLVLLESTAVNKLKNAVLHRQRIIEIGLIGNRDFNAQPIYNYLDCENLLHADDFYIDTYVKFNI